MYTNVITDLFYNLQHLDMSLQDFLKCRGLPEAVIQQFTDEKVSSKVF